MNGEEFPVHCCGYIHIFLPDVRRVGTEGEGGEAAGDMITKNGQLASNRNIYVLNLVLVGPVGYMTRAIYIKRKS